MEDLKSRTKHFALRIIKLYSSLPETVEANVIGKQMLRSGTSVGANYREASRGRSEGEFISKLGIVLQELDETQYWLELIIESEILPESKLKDLHDEASQLIAIFTVIVKNEKKKLK
jgi:four helix bundle protein